MIWKNRRSERETEPSVPTQGGAPALQLLARALAAAIAIFAAVFTPAFAPAAAFADLLPLPTTTITATKVLTAWPEFTGEEFYIGTAECTGLHSLGDTYVAGYWSNEAGAWVAGDGSEAQPNTEEPNGNIRFDWVFTDETGFFGPEGQTYSFESLTQCIDRRGAGTPGCWVENWPHEPDFRPGVYTHAEWYAIFEGVSNGVCTYTITAYITDGTHTWQWIGYQRTQGIIKVQFRTTSSLTLVKQSAKPHVTNGNSLYSLEGVQYGLYASVADAQADANRLHTYTVATDGTTDAASLTVSGATTYYVKELSAGTGYRLDPEVHSVTVHPLENATFTVADEPIMDPFAMRKTVAAAGAAGSTDVNLAGKVRWTVEFYPGAQYASVAAAQASGAPQYTWVITCVASGYAEVSDAYLVSGSPLLYDDGNVPGIPFGTVVCTETWVDPDGPVKLTDTSPRLIWMTATGPRWQEGSSTWTDDIKSGRIHVEKSLLDGSGNPASPAPVAGIQVQVVAATGNVVETLTLDAAGCATSGALAWGTYNLIEVAESVPANMYTWCERQGVPEGTPFATVQVGATDGATVSAAFENELRTGTLTLLKVSADPTVGAGLSIASVAGATYGLYASAEDAEADANRLFTFAIAEDGTSNETPGLEFGTYYVKELSAPVAGGYLMSGTVTAVALDEAAETLTVADTPISGAFSVRKMDAETGAVPQGRATFAGMRVHVAYYPVFAASAADLEGLEPELAWDVETDESGVAVVGEALPAGTYTVRETAAPLGYLLTDTAEHLVVIDAEGVHGAEEGVLTLRDRAVKAAIRVEKTLLHAGGAQGSAQGDASVLAGIRIDVANADTGLVVDTIVLGADGTGTSMPLPIGTYELREVGESVPEGVQPYSWTAAGTTDDIVFASVDIMPDDHGATLTRTFADYASETPRVHKTDIDSGEGLAGAVITLYKVPDEFVTVADGIVTVDEAFNRADLSAWEKVADYTTDAEGYVGLSMVKFGLWAWVETAAPVPYLTEARTADIHATAPIIHEMLFDKDHESRAQSCADKKVSIAVYIKEQTIAVTSAALDAEVAADFRDANNVGTETQWYLISAQNASSVDTEHFTIHMDFDDIRAHGGRVITVTTPVTSGDEDGEGVLSYATVDAPGVWVEWAHISATEPARFSVADLGGVELAGITLDYGWVAKDFTVGPGYNPENGEDLAFEIVYTEALSPADDVVIVHAVDVYTDLAVTAETTIWAVDDDGVRTVVIEPSPKRASGGPGGLPHTGDGANGALAGGIAAAALAALAVSAGALRRGRKGGKR